MALVSHDARAGSGARYSQSLKALSAAQRREAAACDKLAEWLEQAAGAAAERSRALDDGSRAAARLATVIADREEAVRTQRQSELMLQQSRQAEAEAKSAQMRAKAARAEADRARAQADTNDSFRVTPPRSRGARRGG